MKRNMQSVIYGVIINVFIVLILHGTAWSAKEITLVSDPYCPFICDSPKIGQQGYMIDTAREIFTNAGYNVKFTIIPWSRAVLTVRAGEFDGLVGCFKAHAPDLIFPDKNIGISQSKFFKRKNNPWRYNGVESLKKVMLGIVQDYDYGELNAYIRANPKNVQSVPGENALKQNIKKLMAGRIDVIQDNEVVVQYALMQLKLKGEIVEAGKDGSPETYYIAFSPKSPKSKEYAKILSDGIERLRKNGRLKVILNRYGIDDWE